MRNRFVLGFVLGIVATFVTVICIGLGWYFSNEGTPATVSYKTSEKADYIEQIMKAYYLEDIDDKAIEEGVYEGVVSGLGDPYSEYYTAEEYQAMIEESTGIYYGIGALVSQDINTKIITVINPFEDQPADKAGMKKGDIIYKVDDEDVTAQSVDEVVKKLKGEKGTVVKVTVYREEEGKYIDLEITRDEVNVPTVSHKIIDKKNKIGYVQISQFEQVTTEQFRAAMKDLKKKGMKAVIFDVRDNPGGMYDVVCDMLDDILPEGTLVYTMDKYENKQEQKSDKNSIDVPIVVLQNGNSASASEIFAGAIQDYKAGTIVGTQSFGKGIVQTILPLGDGSAVKLTIEKYYTPNGVNIHGTGITPDKVVEFDAKAKEDTQLNEALNILKNELKK